MAEKSMKNGSKIRWMGATYISLYRKMGDAYIKPIYAYMKKWRKPISSLYRLISLEDRSDTDEVQILCFRP